MIIQLFINLYVYFLPIFTKLNFIFCWVAKEFIYNKLFLQKRKFYKINKKFSNVSATYSTKVTNTKFVFNKYYFIFIYFVYVYIIPFFFFFFFWTMFNNFKTIYFLFYDCSLNIYVPGSYEEAKLNKMIIVFRQFILENHQVTHVLSNRELSDIVLEIMGILSEMTQNADKHDLAFEYFQNSELFIEKYSKLYCSKFGEVRANLSDRFTPKTLYYAKHFVKEIIKFSYSTEDNYEITKYVKLTKIKKW